jgi:hypothetical protein
MSGAAPTAQGAQGAPLDAQVIADAIAQAFAAMPAPAAPAPVNLQVVADAIAQAIAALPPAVAPLAPAVDMQVIADAIAAAYNALPAAAAVAAAAAHVVDFAHTPAGASVDLLDYKRITGDAKIFFRATQALPTSFSLAKPNVTVLMSELQTRSSESSWGPLFDMTINAINQNFIASYGRVSLQDLTTHVNTFCQAGSGIGPEQLAPVTDASWHPVFYDGHWWLMPESYGDWVAMPKGTLPWILINDVHVG